MILPLYTSMTKIDQSLVEAAQDLGASTTKTLVRVLIPMSVPGISTGITMVFVPAVSTFVISRMLGGGSNLLIGDLIEMQFLGNSYNLNVGSAMSLVLMIIVLLCMSFTSSSVSYTHLDVYKRQLLGAPQLIILDEPTVGLDPAQVIEIRRLIQELGKTHTVILSSHILSEVQAVCSQVLILSKGHLVAVGAPEQLAGMLDSGSRLHATVLGEGKAVLKAVGEIPGIRRVALESEADGQVTFTAESVDAADRRAEVSRALSRAGCTVLALAAESRTLEEIFLALTEGESDQNDEEEEGKAE